MKNQLKVHVTAKGQITIPAELRRKYGVKPGTRITLFDTGEAILLKPVNEETLRRFQGMLKVKGVLRSLVEGRRKEAE